MMKNIKVRIILLLLIIAGAAYGGLVYFGMLGKETVEIEYKTEKVAKGNIQAAFSVDGKVVFDTWELEFINSGTIEKINVALGDTVKKGQVLAQVNASIEDDRLAQAQAGLNTSILNQERLSSDGVDYEIKKKAYESAKDSLDAENDLYDEYVSQSGKDSTQALAQKVKVRSAEADVDNAKKQLEQVKVSRQAAAYQVDEDNAAYSQVRKNYADYQIVSPVSGAQVAQINGTAGNVFSSNQGTEPFIVLADPDSFWFEAYVEDVDALKITPDMKAYIKLDAYADREFEGKVIFISPIAEIDANDLATYKVVISMEKGEAKLLSDMAGSANLISQEVRDVLMVSNAAFKNKQGKQMVIVKKEGGFEEKEVQVGFTNGKQAEIISGLSAGDEVVIVK